MGLLAVAGSALIASGAVAGSADELTGLWSGTDSYVREGESSTTTWDGTATIERRGDVYTLVYEITQFSQNFDHDSCSSTSVTTGAASATPEENGRLVFVGEATTDITSDCKFYESSGGKAQEVGERSTVGYLMEGDVIRLDLLPASHIEMQPQIEPEGEWGVIVNEDGSVELVPPPDGGALNISRSDLPPWVRFSVVTVGATTTTLEIISDGDPLVLIDGVPVARLGDPTNRGGAIVEGSDLVLVNGRPAAFVGAMTVTPMMNGPSVPWVGGPIVTPGDRPSDSVFAELGAETNATLDALSTYEAAMEEWYGDGLEEFVSDRAYCRLYLGDEAECDRVREEGLVLQEAAWQAFVEELSVLELDEAASSGDDLIEGDFPGVDVGDGVMIGEDPVDVAIVTDKGSLILDQPLRHDHPAGAPVLRIDPSAVDEARVILDDVRHEAGASPASEDDSAGSASGSVASTGSESEDGGTTLVLAVVVGLLAAIGGAIIVVRRRARGVTPASVGHDESQPSG